MALITNASVKKPENKFDLHNEPIFSQILENMVLGQLVSLKEKARIRIPESCVLIGVVDSEGILEEGEVFLQIDQRPYNEDSKKGKKIQQLLSSTDGKETFKTITGEVLVMKNPCSHAGDIRKLKAVGDSDSRWEKLKHLANVVVFSSKGARPEQNKISGGDLDGDVYMTIWDPKFVEPFK